MSADDLNAIPNKVLVILTTFHEMEHPLEEAVLVHAPAVVWVIWT